MAYDFNIIVIGAGSGGLVASLIAAATAAKVALIESDKMGGDCLNTGCVPSKTLIKSANIAYDMAHAEQYGIKTQPVEVDFAAVMARVQRSIDAIAPHDSVERFTELGVNCFQGHAHIIHPHLVEVNGQQLSCRSIIIATGAKAFIPNIPGLSDIDYLCSDNLWQITELPKNLLIIGGGPIGCEMAQAFNRLGANVTIADRNTRLLKIEDADVSQFIQKQFDAEGINIQCNQQLQSIQRQGESIQAVFTHEGKTQTLTCDKVLIALGRQANVNGFGLESLGVKLHNNKTIQANPFLQTNIPNIYVCGDATGPYQFTHAASHQAWYAAINALFSPIKRFKVNYQHMAWCTFVAPEVARVGFNEQEAIASKLNFEVSRYDISDLDRAITEGKNKGFVKVLTKTGSDKILGVTIVSEHAGELISEFILAKTHGLGLNKILSTLHIYPSWSEANKFAAGEWRKKHIPQCALRILQYFHQWRRR